MAIDCHCIPLGIELSPGLMSGCYVQDTNGAVLGACTEVAAGAELISNDHALTDSRTHRKTRTMMKSCRQGANTIVLPGFCPRPYPAVGAFPVVTKSFPEGYCVMAGNPARIIRFLIPLNCTEHKLHDRYIGSIRTENFSHSRLNYLDELGYE